MNNEWRKRIDRAKELARADERTSALLSQYAAILDAQAACYEALVARGGRLTGSLDRDLDELRTRAAEMFDAIADVAPAQAMRNAPTDLSGIEALLRDGWHVPDIPFLARLVLQPYAETLAVLAGSNHLRQSYGGQEDPAYRPQGRGLRAEPSRAACPFCGGPPQVGVLRSDSSADAGGRSLICATCATTWTVPRILCVACGEDDERRLGYFHAPEFDHVRVDACETCRHYIKTVDLTRLGRAIPLVDEVAGAALDLWSHERGYTKVTPNLIGL